MAAIAGIHPVLEALRASRPLDRILVVKGVGGQRLQDVIDRARVAGIPVRFEPRTVLDKLAGTAAHQGVVALGAARQYARFEEVSATARLLVALDGVEDPHNLGAIIRTALAAGSDALVIPERRAAGLSDVVAKAAAGALEHLPVVRVGNLTKTLTELKDRGYWIYGLDERGTSVYHEVAYASPAVIVLGGEGKGLHDLVRRHCDVLVRIPMTGAIPSLNVSVAAGIVLFDWAHRFGRKP
ncbi:MAG: 23S rRNA (guanosine(2251)-2'-O)-methyltransferase RlmB [Bryobacterales bacterium]|nr:23S rRNA (guanosine(2251)-2'-O)-methyltransferase RlmB [Bryobacterales bacterium]